MDEMGFEVTKIDYTSFRRNFGSLMNQELMKEDRKKIMHAENEKKKQYEKEQEAEVARILAKFQ